MTSPRSLPMVLLCLWLAIIMHLYLLNVGGSGLKLPQNIIAWGAMALLTLVIWPGVRTKQGLIITPASGLFLAGAVALSIPLLYTQPEWRGAAILRLTGLLGGWIFYFTLLQWRPSPRQRGLLLYLLLAAVCIQSLLALLQLFAPEPLRAAIPYPLRNGRPYGVFQQVNLLGSFVATGLALTLMLFLLPGFALRQMRTERWRRAGLGVLLLLFPALLVWLQSRIGGLGGIVVALLFLLRYSLRYPRCAAGALLLMVSGVLLGYGALWLEVGVSVVSHASSDSARYAMLRDSLRMIAEKPWLGWGYGGFEYSFQHFRIAQSPPIVSTEIARHPHNELLLWAVEGGMVALPGLLLLLAGGVLLLRMALWYDRQEGALSSGAPALCFALLPLALHTQTEYPFSLSVTHWALFLLLLALLDSQVNAGAAPVARFTSLLRLLRIAVPALALCTLLLMASGLYSAMLLTCAERAGLKDISAARAAVRMSPWLHAERFRFDEQTHGLLVFNQNRDAALLDEYVRWAEAYLQRRIDANVYATLGMILQHRGQGEKAQRLRAEAALLFPQDKRFTVAVSASNAS